MNSLLSKLFRGDDRAFHMGVAMAMCIIYATGAGVPLILDPLLVEASAFRGRQYPGHVYWQVPILAATVLIATYSILQLFKPTYRVWVACVPMLLAGSYTFSLLRPEVPHSFLAIHMTFGSVTTTIAVWIRHCSLDSDYISRGILPQAKIERAKAEISFWQTGLWYLIAGFFVVIVAWVKLGREITDTITPNAVERVFVNKAQTFGIGLHSIWFLVGVLGQVIRKCREAFTLLEKIPDDSKEKP